MKTILALIICLLSLESFAKGDLLLIGGGKRTPELLKKMIELSKGKTILLIPLASEIPEEVMADIKKEFSNLDYNNVDGFLCKADSIDEAQCLKQINEAGFIFFTGGDQNRLMKALSGTKALELIFKLNADSLPLGGTSAGTAIMSEVMLTGSTLSPYSEFDGIRPNMVETTRGFGLVKKMVVDQHFLKRGRENRLMSAVFDHPGLIGVGIDEATAILVHENENFEVLGESAVMVIDPRNATVTKKEKNFEVQGLKLDLLGSGKSFKF